MLKDDNAKPHDIGPHRHYRPPVRRFSSHSSLGAAVRNVLFVTNAVALICSLGGLLFAAVFLDEYQYYECIVQCTIYLDICNLLMATAVIFTIFASVMFYLVINELRYFILTLSGAYLILVLFYGMTGAFSWVFEFQVGHNIEYPWITIVLIQLLHVRNMQQEMEMSLKELYGRRGFDDVTYAWDHLQKQMKCCSVMSNLTDTNLWWYSKWRMWTDTNGRPLAGDRRVPESCCRTKENLPNEFVNLTACVDSLAEYDSDYLNIQGCYKPLQMQLLRWTHTAGTLSFVNAFALAFPAVFGILYGSMIQK